MTPQVGYASTTGSRELLLAPRAYDHPDSRALVLALYKDQLARYGHAEYPHCDVRGVPPAGRAVPRGSRPVR